MRIEEEDIRLAMRMLHNNLGQGPTGGGHDTQPGEWNTLRYLLNFYYFK